MNSSHYFLRDAILLACACLLGLLLAIAIFTYFPPQPKAKTWTSKPPRPPSSRAPEMKKIP